MGKGGGKTEQTRLVPWDAQKDYLKKVFSEAEGLYSGPKQEVLNYYGEDWDRLSAQPGLWGSMRNADTAYADPNAPTVARFTPAQETAQKRAYDVAIANLGAGATAESADTAIRKIINESNKINPASMSAANVVAPTAVTAPKISATPSMQAADIGSTLLNFRNWDDLGDMVKGTRNQYLDDMVEAATRDVRTAYQEDIFPGINSAANAGGRYRSGAWSALQARAADDYLDTIADLSANIRGRAYETDRNRVMEAMGLSGQLASAQANIDADRASRIGGFGQEANRLNTQLEQERNLAGAGYEMTAGTTNLDATLRRLIQDAQMKQEANRLNAGFTQEAGIQNLANILQGIAQAPEVTQMKYNDIANMAAAGAEQQLYGQTVLDAFKDREAFEEMKAFEELNLFNQFVQGEYGGTTTSTGGGGKFGF